MCEPTMVMAGVAIVSAAYSANQQKQQSKYQAGVDEYNAREAENEATEVRNAGVEAENDQRQKTAQLLARQRAQLGAANVDLSSGSALQLQEDTQTLGEVDALRIRSNYENKATSLDASSTLLTSNASNALTAGSTAATGTLLQGASSAIGTGVADKWFTPASSATLAGSQNIDYEMGVV